MLNFTLFSVALLVSWIVGLTVPPTWSVTETVLDVHTDIDGHLYYIARG